jgi:hypothetical protein
LHFAYPANSVLPYGKRRQKNAKSKGAFAMKMNTRHTNPVPREVPPESESTARPLSFVAMIEK